ncbi:XkdW family protein [Alicyclobacillus sp. ALC3]|uniref:XkdW family protein n=1 Tax=Alicyclobacillus sp. ALC3 TaxID=2796143 RepID=UPI0023784616|nr:XkdW family protein [Alicyclobacillus sp. ALC3]WDL98118.1 hypothetical protein JC200_05300 [Alicyclobacillus sp. ALC3]
MDIILAVQNHYPDMVLGVGFVVGNDAYGNQVITYWDTTKHTLPSQTELADWWTAYLQSTQVGVIATAVTQQLATGFTSTTAGGKVFPLDVFAVAMLAGEYAYLKANSTATPKGLRALDGSVWTPTQTEYFSFSDELRTFLGGLEDKQWAKEALIATVSDAVIPTVLWNAPTVPQGLTGMPGGTSGTVTLTWAGNPDTDLASYNVYQDGVKIGSVTTNSDSITGLTTGTTYTFAVTAVDASGGESVQSVSVSVTAP